MTAHYREQPVWTPSAKEHSHNVYHIVMYVGGHNAFMLNGKSVQSKPGVVVFVQPGVSHSFVKLANSPCVYNELTFCLYPPSKTCADFSEVFSQMLGVRVPAFGPVVQLEQKEIEGIDCLYCRLLERLSCGTSPVQQAKATVAFFDVLTEIADRIILQGDSVELATTVYPLDRIRNYIEQNYVKPLCLDGLSKHAHLSKEYFCRAFRKRFGVSPIGYQLGLRIAAACTLLETTGLTCSEIARRLGFSDIYSFSKTFRKRMSISPTEHRKITGREH